MFAKLKKKIQEEGGGAPIDGDRTPASGPYGSPYASPISKDAPGNIYSPARKDSIKHDHAAGDPGAAACGGTQGGIPSGEETSSLLQKKSEQIKKMEGKVSELAAMIKEKNKSIGQLEISLLSYQDMVAEKFRDLMGGLNGTDSTSSSETKRENNKDKPELCGSAADEFVKLQKLLTNMHRELTEAKAARIHMTEQMQSAKMKKENLESEVQGLMQQVSELTTRCETAEDTLKAQEENLETLNAEKQSLFLQVEDLQKDNSQKTSHLSQVQQELANLQDQHITLQRNSDLHRQKITNMLEEKDEVISHLGERIETLEQRLKENDLSGDDRVQALITERTNMERKLTEARQQLSEVKTTWSDKISLLEKQIANLNEKMAEDSTDWARKQQSWENSEAEYLKQITELEHKVTAGQNKLHESEETAKHKDRLLGIQKEALEKELTRMKQNNMTIEGELRSQLESAHAQYSTLQSQYNQATAKMRDLMSGHDDYLEKEIDFEKQITQLEDELHQAKVDVAQRDKELNRMRRELQDKTTECNQLKDEMRSMENNVDEQLVSVKENEHKVGKIERDLKRATAERDTLLIRNAELSQKVESLKKSGTEKSRDLERDVKDKDNAIAGLEQALQEVQADLSECRRQLEEERSAHEVKVGQLEADEIKRLRESVKTLEDQLSDKSKTIKVQQQRLTDLKKTLQRELKVQALPNDEIASDGEMSRPTPATLNVASSTANFHNGRIHIPKSTSLNQLNKVGLGSSGTTLANRCINCSRNKDGTPYTGPAPIFDESNFEYLKHVILKFMLSRETEAVQLIRAVSTLLHFTEEEQRLLKDTFDYKMSWFGSRPKLGKGQKAKVIPPSY